MEFDILIELLESWWSFILLALIIWYTLSKWIPFMIDKHNERLKEQDWVYKTSLREISSSFTNYMDKLLMWHEEHNKTLVECYKRISHIESKVDNN